jgi:hypothetical protein
LVFYTSLIEIDLIPTTVAIGVWLTVSLTLVYYVRKLYYFATGKVSEIEEKLESNSVETALDAAFQKYAPATQKMMIATMEHLSPKIGDQLYSAIGDALHDVLHDAGRAEFGKKSGNTKIEKAAMREGQKQFIQAGLAQKLGPEVAAIASGLGLDEMGVEALADNPQLAGLIMSFLQKGGSNPPTKPANTSGTTGWP